MTTADDEDLFERLKEAVVERDPEPANLKPMARGTFAWRDIDGELARLSFDSADAEPSMAVRASFDPRRVLTFEGSWATIDLEVTPATQGLEVTGQLVPVQAGLIEAVTGSESIEMRADSEGRFQGRLPSRGPVRFLLRSVEGRQAETIRTDWVVI